MRGPCCLFEAVSLACSLLAFCCQNVARCRRICIRRTDMLNADVIIYSVLDVRMKCLLPAFYTLGC